MFEVFLCSFNHSVLFPFAEVPPERDGGDRVPVRAAAEGDQLAEPAQVDHRAQAGGCAQELVLQKSGMTGTKFK